MEKLKPILPYWAKILRFICLFPVLFGLGCLIYLIEAYTPDWVSGFFFLMVLFPMSILSLFYLGEIWDLYTDLFRFVAGLVFDNPTARLETCRDYIEAQDRRRLELITVCDDEIIRLTKRKDSLESQITTKKAIVASFLATEPGKVALEGLYITELSKRSKAISTRRQIVTKLRDFLYDLEINWHLSWQDLKEQLERRKEEFKLFNDIQLDLKREGNIKDFNANILLYNRESKRFDETIWKRIKQIDLFEMECNSLKDLIPHNRKIRDAVTHMTSKLWNLPPNYDIFDTDSKQEVVI